MGRRVHDGVRTPCVHDVGSEMDIDGVSILAHGITAKGTSGTVFEGVNLRVTPGTLAVISGPAGSGRTALLLALSGRLRLLSGLLDIDGYLLPQHEATVRELIVPARLRPGFELERTHRVREAARERLTMAGLSAPVIDDTLAMLGIEPDPSALVGELPPIEQLLLAIGLAAAEAPAGMVVDDIELGLTPAERPRAWTALRQLTATGMTIVASSTETIPEATTLSLAAGRQPQDRTEVLR